jgi:hypothetical protein
MKKLTHWLEGFQEFWKARFNQLDTLLQTMKNQSNEK